ncbi:hypothetical protein [Streptomyces sp. NBC_00519]|uniref:hypothetical protein n=1 Tax=Streptomyces sp. NBC_00519 TaxID=2975764 RepID=UPI0030E30277
MDTVLAAGIWLAEAIGRLRSVGWWLVPVVVPGLMAWAWQWLRPTGKRRRPRPRRFPRPSPPAPPSPPPTVLDEDTIVFQRVTYADASTARGGGEADR